MQSKLSRFEWGLVLAGGGAIALFGAFLLDVLGLRSPETNPVAFVGTLVGVKLGLFAFWPVLSEKGRLAGLAIRSVFDHERAKSKVRSGRNRQELKKGALALWDEHDPRLDLSMFAANVPTFVLNHEQRFIDWNPAFDIVFGHVPTIKRGGHVSHWFKLLDNFRRVPKRTAKLYGEGIIPITDRERATYISKEWGRMVFTKIMSPIIDRRSGRIIGWNVVLNINSVNKRNEFFEKLFSKIELETKRIRYAASYDGLFEGFSGRDQLMALHAEGVLLGHKILDLGSATGALADVMMDRGASVTCVEHEVHLLRRIKDKAELSGHHPRIVRQDLDDMKGVPAGRYDAVTIMHSIHRLHDPSQLLAAAYKAMKPGGRLTVSDILATGGIEAHYNAVRTHLEASGRYETLKHQFNHVLDFEREMALRTPYKLPTREELRALVLEAGFMIDSEHPGLEDGHTLLLVARK